jgi:hypothetical protein
VNSPYLKIQRGLQQERPLFGRDLLKGDVGRSRCAAEKNLNSLYTCLYCPIPGIIKPKGGIP